MDSRISKAGVYPAQILRSIEELKKPEQEEQIKTGLFPSVSFDADNMDIIDLGFVEGTESGPVPFPNQNSKPVQIGDLLPMPVIIDQPVTLPIIDNPFIDVDDPMIGEDGKPVRYDSMMDLPKGATIVQNEDGTWTATVSRSGMNIGGDESVTYNFDKQGNLVSYTHNKEYSEIHMPQSSMNYDKYGNMTGGTLTFKDRTINLPPNSEVKARLVQIDDSQLVEEQFEVITTEEFANPCIVDPSRTNVNKRVTTMKYDMDGVELGKNVTEEITNPKATVSLDYKKSNLCIYPAQYDITGGTISFENGETFDVPAGSKVSYQDGKIVVIAYTQDGIKKYILGDNGLESEENITLTLDPTPKPVVIESREIIQESIPKKMRQIFDNSNKLY